MKFNIKQYLRFFALICVSLLPYQLNAQSQIIRRKTQSKPSTESRNSNGNLSNDKIERNIDGIILCVSTQQDVISKLKQKGLEYKEYADGYVIISNGKLHYMGIDWEAVMYKFYHNKVWTIVYVTGDKNNKGRKLMAFKYALENSCYKKYKKFYIPSQNGTYYSDSKTGILIQNNFNSNQDISLTIGDIAISNLLVQ